MTTWRRQQALRSDSAGRFCSRILSWLALWEISCLVFLWRSWLRLLAMSGHKARKPDAPKSVKKFFTWRKVWIVTRARNASRPKWLQKRLDVPRLLLHVTVYSDKPIVRNFEFLAINRYSVIFECSQTLRYSDTLILRNFEYFCKN